MSFGTKPSLTSLWLGLVGLAAVAAASGPATATDRLAAVLAAGRLTVCIWPDYYGITFHNSKDDKLYGIDIELSRAFAGDLGVALEYRDSSFPKFIDDLVNDRCDVAMFGVGILPDRAARVAFSAPYLRSDIYAIVLKHDPRFQTWDDLDQPGTVIAVQGGTFMEPVMRERLKAADLLVVRPPDSRERELQAGRADAFMTDYPYSRRLLDNADWARLVAPPSTFFQLPYGYAVKPDQPEWLDRVNQFVAAIKQDGRLAAAARANGLEAIILAD